MKILLLIWGVACIVLGFWLNLSAGLSWHWSAFIAVAVCLLMLALVDWTLDSVNIFIPLRDHLVADWRHAWRWFSVQLMAAAGIIELLEIALRRAWLDLPPAILAVVPADILSTLSIGLLVLGIMGRMVKQKSAQAET